MTHALTAKKPSPPLRDVTGKIWSLGECLGHGAFARVYSHDANHVIKVFKTKQSYSNELFAYQSLFAEALVGPYKSRRGLGHLGLPRMYAHGHAGVYFMVLQKLFPIKQLIDGSYRDNNLVMMLVQLLDVLEFLHQNNWTHNDIKYDNIMIDQHRNFYLIDYGLVTSFIDAQELPSDKPIVGTGKYMSLDAHRGFVNPPRGDLVNIAFMLKLLLTAPWDVDKHAYSVQTSLLIEKEAFASAPSCGTFTAFCKAIFSLEYNSLPNYKHLKGLLPRQPKVETIRGVHNAWCGVTIPPWGFATIFQTHILPYLYRLTKKLFALKAIKPGKIDISDLIYIVEVNRGNVMITDGLDLIGESSSHYTKEAGLYISAAIENWIIHVAKELSKLIEECRTVNRAMHRLTAILSSASP